MRYFFSPPLAKSVLPLSVTEPTTAARTVATGRSMQGVCSRLFGAALRAIHLSAVAPTTDHDLVMTAQAVIESSTRFHRHQKADECWI
jgi:hypothetical protein